MIIFVFLIRRIQSFFVGRTCGAIIQAKCVVIIANIKPFGDRVVDKVVLFVASILASIVTSSRLFGVFITVVVLQAASPLPYPREEKPVVIIGIVHYVFGEEKAHCHLTNDHCRLVFYLIVNQKGPVPLALELFWSRCSQNGAP
jgi:hypothetical protein